MAVVAGTAAQSALTRKPTPAERSAAARRAVANRWRDWPAGRIFPARLGYSTALLTRETANRIGISANGGCGAAVEGEAGRVAAGSGCVAAVRASYEDELRGIVYTIGVLAFPDARHAAAFLADLRSAGSRLPLRALALARTASARFDDAARQAATARARGPFVVLTAAGYADGRPAGPGSERRPSIFAPAAQLAAEILGPLARPVTVDCKDRSWAC